MKDIFTGIFALFVLCATLSIVACDREEELIEIAEEAMEAGADILFHVPHGTIHTMVEVLEHDLESSHSSVD